VGGTVTVVKTTCVGVAVGPRVGVRVGVGATGTVGARPNRMPLACSTIPIITIQATTTSNAPKADRTMSSRDDGWGELGCEPTLADLAIVSLPR
jgi:hypothetical protein